MELQKSGSTAHYGDSLEVCAWQPKQGAGVVARERVIFWLQNYYIFHTNNKQKYDYQMLDWVVWSLFGFHIRIAT